MLLRLTPLVVFSVLAGNVVAADIEYQSQDSSQTFYHSGIVTSTGVVWDTQFATMVGNSLGVDYNEVAFAFNQCYSGGMIDELTALHLVPASYTSAARHNEMAWGGSRDPASGANKEWYYNIHYSPVAGGAAAQSQLSAATVGRALDLVGPVVKNPEREHPQYTSSGLIGDSIILHRNNPNNNTANTKYLAVLFGGSEASDLNQNSLARTTGDLAARGYAAGEERIVNPGGTAAQLRDAWNWVKANTNATTQVYYWNDAGHGTRAFDLIGWIGEKVKSGARYLFNLATEFISDVKNHFNFFKGQGGAGPLAGPYFEVQASSYVSDLSITLNDGYLLKSLGWEDFYGDGTLFSYRFALDDLVIQSLATSGNSFQMAWIGPADPGFQMADLNVGNLANGPSSVPEPSALSFIVMGLAILGFARRRKLH